nr:MAG TPA: Inosine-5'-monophosphate dehydrogenase,Inosine-5'-monophosphate dehydrogenase [Caudoviricetes sp.]
MHLCEKLILIRHGATLFGVFLSLPARFTKINNQ